MMTGAGGIRPAQSRAMLLAASIMLVLWATCGCDADLPRQSALPEPAQLQSLYDAHDFFALRDLLSQIEPAAGEPPDVLFYRAAVRHAFNDPVGSTALLDELLAAPDLDVDIARRAHRVRRDNYLRMHDYAAALSASRALLAISVEHDNDDQDARNTQRLLEALQDVPPQRAVVREASMIPLDRESGTGLRIPVKFEGAERLYIFDTGANYSVLMRSEAEALGLEVHQAAIDVGNSVGGTVSADIAIASRMSIGSIDYRHVVFLVMPDEVLTFLEVDVTIPGILGFPVMEAMGEVRFHEESLEVPRETPRRTVRNLAFEQLEPLVRVGYGEESLLCRFDTGANRTDLYEPFYRRFQDLIESTGSRRQITSAGVGEKREIDAYVLPRVELGVGKAKVRLQDVHVQTEPLSDETDENYLDCNLGRDALDDFDEYLINFRSMSLILGRAN